MLAIFNYLSPCREFYHNKHMFGKFARYISAKNMYFQDQSCYFEGYKKSITCQCDINLDKSFLLLRLAYNIRDIGQEVSALVLFFKGTFLLLIIQIIQGQIYILCNNF